jgi:hypothetical protein
MAMLVAGASSASLGLVYASIAVSILAVVILGAGVLLRRRELFGAARGDGAAGWAAAGPAGTPAAHAPGAPAGGDQAKAGRDARGDAAARLWGEPAPGEPRSRDRGAGEPAAPGRGRQHDRPAPGRTGRERDQPAAWAADRERPGRGPDRDRGQAEAGRPAGAPGAQDHAASGRYLADVAGAGQRRQPGGGDGGAGAGRSSDERTGDESAAAEGQAANAGAASARDGRAEGEDATERTARGGEAGRAADGGGAPLDEEVTIVPGVARYHRRGCILIRFLSDGDLEAMTRREAEAAGSVPCKACQPDKANPPA